MSGRLRAFILVGAGGFGLQLVIVAVMTWIFEWPSAAATALGVEAAVLHNFFWHQRWTWPDRQAAARHSGRRLLRFHLTTGATSVAGNVVAVLLAVHILGLDAVVANVLAVGAMSVVNYLVADRYVFAPMRAAVTVAVVVAALIVTPRSAPAAELTPQTLAGWNAHVAATEATLAQATPPDGSAGPVGREIQVPGGLIHEWRGTVSIPGITVSQLVNALTNPGTPPPQDDVIESRVLARDGDRLRVYLKVVRTAIITVTYDTEHDVTFVRHGAEGASSRSVATTITEAGGDDHGFLWKLNSYWQYRQTPTGVQVDVLSLSLSRGVPMVLRPIAGRIVNRVARESMTRTLDAVRRFGEHLLPSNSPLRVQRTPSSP
jgi:putative flippase GtrA